jgi:formylmethanofuran dehydrogenase subunit B
MARPYRRRTQEASAPRTRARRATSKTVETIEVASDTETVENFEDRLLKAVTGAAQEERQAIYDMIQATYQMIFTPLGMALQDGRYANSLSAEQLIEHLKALAQTAERIRRGDHRQTPQT